MEIAVFVRRFFFPKKNQHNNHYGWKQLYRSVHSNSKSSYMIQEREGREGPVSVHQPKEVLAHRKHTVLVLDEEAFPPLLPKAGGHLSLLPIPSEAPT